MGTNVRACSRCQKLMWLKEDAVTYLDENTVEMTCPHCQLLVRFKLITEGANAVSPKMGH